MIQNRSAPGGDIIPGLIYNDIHNAVDWLCDVFGFKERLRITAADGKVSHAQLAIGSGGVILSSPRIGQGFANAPDAAELRTPRPNEVSQTLSVHVEDVDRHYAHAKERGARILSPPQTCPFGERQYTAEDLDGHRWTFSQSVADVKPEVWGATVSETGSSVERLPGPRGCYLEIPAIDTRQSAAFYEKVFGWSIRHEDSDRPTFADPATYVSGTWISDREPVRTPGVLPYIWVRQIDDILARVIANGGEVVETDHAGNATFRDPAGNVIGLFQEGPR